MIRSISAILILIVSTTAHTFEIAFSQEKSSWTKHIVSLSFLDPVTHDVITTTVLGEMGNMAQASGFADEQQEFFYVLLPGTGLEPWQLVVFSIKDHAEITRLPIGKSNHAKHAFETQFIRISADGKLLIAIGPDKKRSGVLMSIPDLRIRLNGARYCPGELLVRSYSQLGTSPY